MRFLGFIRKALRFLVGVVVGALLCICAFRALDYVWFKTGWFKTFDPWYMQLVYWAIQAAIVVVVLVILIILIKVWMTRKNGGVDPEKQKADARREVSKVSKESILWSARKRNALGLPWTFTKYSLDEDRLYIQKGFFNTTEDEIRLYRITDVTLNRGMWQKLFGMGTIHCDSSDATMNNFNLKNVKKSKEVKNMLSELVDRSRIRNRVYTTESVNGGPHHLENDIPIDRTDADGDGIPDALER